MASAAATALVISSYLIASHVGPSASTRHVPASGAPAGPFAGSWRVHTYTLDIATDGSGTFQWPIHVKCIPVSAGGQRPCDTLVPTTTVVNGVPMSGDDIIYGGHATLVLTSRHGNTAEGVVQTSTQPSHLPDGPATLRIAADDVLHITTAVRVKVWPFAALCGPRAASLPISTRVAEGINCGA